MEPHIVNYFKENGFWLIIPVVSSIIYFRLSKNEKLLDRVFVSAHGLILAIASIYSIVVSQITSRDDHYPKEYILLTLMFFGIISIVYGLAKYKGDKWVHLMQIYNVIFAFLATFVGAMAITHDWI